MLTVNHFANVSKMVFLISIRGKLSRSYFLKIVEMADYHFRDVTEMVIGSLLTIFSYSIFSNNSISFSFEGDLFKSFLISSARHTIILELNLTGLGKRPVFTPFNHVVLPTGIIFKTERRDSNLFSDRKSGFIKKTPIKINIY